MSADAFIAFCLIIIAAVLLRLRWSNRQQRQPILLFLNNLIKICEVYMAVERRNRMFSSYLHESIQDTVPPLWLGVDTHSTPIFACLR